MSFGQGGPGWGPGGSTPDWVALAEQAERARARRRRWLMIGGGAVATAVVAAIVATAVVNEGGSGGAGASASPSSSLPPAETLPPTPEQPEPTFSEKPPPPPPPDPRDFLSSSEKDTAPLSTETLFPGASMASNGRTYQKGATASTEQCATAAQGALGAVLTDNGCRELIRATYVRDGIAVTVGVAVFDTAAAAEKAKAQAKPNVTSLPGAGVPTFCRGVVCSSSANALGRYAYFTIAGYTDGRSVTASTAATEAVRQAGLDTADFAFARILKRGQDQATASATDG